MRRLRLSLRARLTLVYGSLFFVTACVLIAVTYLFTSMAVNAKFQVHLPTQGRAGDRYHLNGTPGLEQLLAERREEILDRLLQVSVLTTIALSILAFAVGYVVAGRMIRPLHTVTATARRLSESNLHERIGLAGPVDEIKELADTFDGMLDRLYRAFDSKRRFVANASHELRTPLAISRTNIEVALARPGVTPEIAELCTKLLAATARHERLIDGLLTLTRSEQEPRNRTPVDVAVLAANAIDQMLPSADQAGVDVGRTLEPGQTTGNPVLLERAVTNLLENAIKYNVPDGRMRVVTGEAAGHAFVTVENTGPVVSPENAVAIFEPFRRLPGPRLGAQRGAGLGLSIVSAVMDAHGGSVEARPRRPGGLTVTLRLPLTPHRAPRPDELAGRSPR